MTARDILDHYHGQIVSLTLKDGSRKIGKILQIGAFQKPKPTPDPPESICFFPISDLASFREEDTSVGKCEWIDAGFIAGVDSAY